MRTRRVVSKLKALAVVAMVAIGCNSTTGASGEDIQSVTEAVTIDDLHNSATIVVAHTHRLTNADFESAIAGGTSGLGLDLIVDGNDWVGGLRTAVPGWDSDSRFATRLATLQNQVVASGNRYRIAKTVRDIQCSRVPCGPSYPNPPTLAIVVGSEGAQLLESQTTPGLVDRSRIAPLYALGWRKTQLGYAYANVDFNLFYQQLFSGGSLTPAGALTIAELNRVGVTIDTMHLQEFGGTSAVTSLIAASSAPLLTSHSYPPQYLNTTDPNWVTLARQVAESGGGYGVIGFLAFTSSTNNTVHYYSANDVNAVASQLAVAKTLLGEDHIAFGGDYMPPHTNLGGEYTYAPATLSGLKDLTTALRANGFSDAQILKVLGANMLSLYDRTWDPTRGYNGGPARFYTCSNSDASPECVALRGRGGQGDFNHRPVSCRAPNVAGPIGLQIGWNPVSGWFYWGINGLQYPCQDGSLVAVSWADGAPNAAFRMCGELDSDPICIGARANGGSGTSSARAINCGTPSWLGNAGVVGLQLVYTGSGWSYITLAGTTQGCAMGSTLTTGWGAGVSPTAQVQLCDNKDGNASCDAAKMNGSRGNGLVRAISCYAAAPSADLHGNVGLELVWTAAFDSQLQQTRGRWMYYGINGVLYPCVEGSVLIVRQG